MAGFKNGLQKVGDVYHFCFRLNRKQFKGSTRAHDLPTARKVLEGKRREALVGRSTKRREAPTFSALVQDWMWTHSKTASDRHIQNVELITRIWLTPYIGSLPVDQVTRGMILQARSRMLEAGRSMATANHLVRVVKLLWNHALEDGAIESIPFKVKPLRVQQRPRPTIPASRVPEYLALVDTHSHSRQIAAMLKIMVGLGMRESEVLGMKWEWFDPDRRTYTIGKSKGKEARVLPVPEWLWDVIQAMPKTLSAWVFPAVSGERHHPHYCRKVLKKVSDDLGLGNLTQHRLRATFATLHAEAGTPITEIQGMLGHKSITTTMIYIEQSLEAKRRAQDTLSEKLGLAKPNVTVRRKILPLVKVQPRLRHG